MAKIKLNTARPISPMIYAYTTPNVSYHDGWTKIGYTERDVDTRIKEQTQTANIEAKKEWQDVAIFSDGKTRFTDREFHAYLQKNDIPRKEPKQDDEGCPEWFKISGGDSFILLGEFRHNQGILEQLEVVPYTLRDEQKKAVEHSIAYFKANKQGECLWNAKPRFGKTLATYDLCMKLNVKKALIVTNRPAIANSWYDDYEKFIGRKSGYYFVSETDALRSKKYVSSRKTYLNRMDDPDHKGCIEFVSLQDLKGSLYFGGSIDKLAHISELKYDILIIDEAHEGVDTSKTDTAFNEIKREYTLHLSGTPFKALANEKFPTDAIFNWTYTDEQKAKENWDDTKEEENPYANLPKLNLFTYKMSDLIRDKVEQGADFDDDGEKEAYCFDLNEFFKTNASGNFIHDDAVDKFLDALTSQEKFPFSTDELRNELRHTLWMLQYVDSAKALAKKIKQHDKFKDYYVVVAAGDGKSDDESHTKLKKSFDRVKEAIKSYDKTITISVGQLTVGSTVPEWSAVMMLSNMTSPSLYVQASFRAQNPCLFNINGESLRKENAYVFDFDPARTLSIMENFANSLRSDSKQSAKTNNSKENIGELLNFFPIYAEDDDGEMIELDAEQVLSIPRAIHAKEVVRRGFMSNFLFKNVSNVFNASQEMIETLQKLEPIKEPIIINENIKEDIDENGNVSIDKDKIIGIASELFGEKIYEIDKEAMKDIIESTQKEMSKPTEMDEKVDALRVVLDIKSNQILDIAKEKYGNDVSKSTEASIKRKIDDQVDKTLKKQLSTHDITIKKLENERSKEIEKAGNNKDKIEIINAKFDKEKEKTEKDFDDNIEKEIGNMIAIAGQIAVGVIETNKKEKKINEVIDGARDRLRGFSRTIPSFIMAYGDDNTTLENFDTIIPDEVFKEVTSISLDEFRQLRDGDGGERSCSGFFDPFVFNDSVKEFLKKKNELSNYFDENAQEDVFDYIPPQKTNQIFTPKNVVKMMVDMLEKENPECFDDPNKTFIDLYMKSGLYITEIVKRLYRSKKMKKLYPDDSERLNHIFEKQVYGLAPTEIIYKIAISFILGFDDKIKIKKFNLKQLDTLPYAKDGTLEKKLDEVFGNF